MMKYAALIFAIVAVVFCTMYFMKTKELNTEIASLTSKTSQLEVSVSEKDTQIETLNDQINTLNDQIGTLTNEVTSKDAMIDTLNGTIADRDADISTLSLNSNLRKWQIELLTTHLAEKSATIETLNESISGYEQTLGTMGEYNRELEVLLVEAGDLLAKIGELNTAIESEKEATPSDPKAGVNTLPTVGGDNFPVTKTEESATDKIESETSEKPVDEESGNTEKDENHPVTVGEGENPAETEAADHAETVPAAENTATDETSGMDSRSAVSQMFHTTLEQNPELEHLISASFEKAAEINPDHGTNPVQSLGEFYDFIDASASHIPEVRGKNLDGKQRILYLNWLLDQPLDELKDKELFRPTVRYLEPVSIWLTEYNRVWKEFLDSENSWNPEYYDKLLSASEWNLDKGWYESSENWNSFNDFFSRRLSGADVRPVAEPDHSSVVAAPADSVPQGIFPISEDGSIGNSAMDEKDTAAIPSVTVDQILGETGAEYAALFHGGYLAHLMLNDNDYHHFHSPVSGTVKSVYLLPYTSTSGGIVTWDPEKQLYVRKSDSLYWLQSETRGVVMIKTEAGMVALIPVGMGQVSGLEFLEGIQPETDIKKGDEVGFFQFDGSDCILLFESKSGFTFTAPVKTEEESEETAHILCGEEYGRFAIASETESSATPDEAETRSPAAPDESEAADRASAVVQDTAENESAPRESISEEDALIEETVNK